MDPSVVISALIARYGQTDREMNRSEREIFNNIVILMDSDADLIEDYVTLGIAGGVDEDDDMCWGDAPVGNSL